jgi:hypothetical protein
MNPVTVQAFATFDAPPRIAINPACGLSYKLLWPDRRVPLAH